MRNGAIRIAINEKPESGLADRAGVSAAERASPSHTHYTLSVCEVAFAAYRNRTIHQTST